MKVLYNFLNTFLQGLKNIVIFLKNFLKYDDRDCYNYVIFKNSSFLVVNKRFDIMLNSNDMEKYTLQCFLREKYPSLANPNLKHDFFFVHRLDFATSGLVCIALNKNTCKEATYPFEKRKTKKYYVALVRGHVSQRHVDISLPIAKSTNGSWKHKMCVSTSADCSSAKPALTKLLLLELGYFENYPASKVLLYPITGRTHQLRVHCSYLGHTIVGDYTYSNRRDVTPSRMYLHSLRLILPTSQETLDVQTEDIFTPRHTNNLWKPVKTFHEINEQVFQQFK